MFKRKMHERELKNELKIRTPVPTAPQQHKKS
jgi:hypothetical protein